MPRLAFDLSVLSVLLVEGDTFAREFERTALQRLGVARLTVAEDGAEALDILKRGTVCDMIISGWNLPDVDGLDVLQAVRKEWSGIAYLMMASSESLDQVKDAISAGADGYVIKPFSLGKLREAMQLALITRVTGAVTGGGRERPVHPEFEKIAGEIRRAITEPSESGKLEGGNSASPAVIEDANRLAEQISRQLTDFIAAMGQADKQRLEVIRLHADCMRAVLSGRADLLDHETRNMIIDGLNLARDLVSH